MGQRQMSRYHAEVQYVEWLMYEKKLDYHEAGKIIFVAFTKAKRTIRSLKKALETEEEL